MGTRTSDESQEDQGEPWGSQEEPGGARRNQKGPGGARRSQSRPGGARSPGGAGESQEDQRFLGSPGPWFLLGPPDSYRAFLTNNWRQGKTRRRARRTWALWLHSMRVFPFKGKQTTCSNLHTYCSPLCCPILYSNSSQDVICILNMKKDRTKVRQSALSSTRASTQDTIQLPLKYWLILWARRASVVIRIGLCGVKAGVGSEQESGRGLLVSQCVRATGFVHQGSGCKQKANRNVADMKSAFVKFRIQRIGPIIMLRLSESV